MNKFTQHMPNFVDTREPAPCAEFETTEDLLNLEIMQKCMRRKDFSHFAMQGNCLMEISDNGFFWWVIGYIKYPSKVDLPKWEGWKYKAKLPDGSRVILTGNEVIYVSGDILTLQDGTKAEIIH